MLPKETKRFSKIKIRPEPFFYRNAKVSGIILILGSVFILYSLATFNFYSVIPYLPRQLPPLVWNWLLQAGQIFFFICSSFILIFGLVVFIRPSLIKSFEKNANRWFSTQPFFLFLNKIIDITNKWLNLYPRTIGAFFTLFSFVILYFFLTKT